MLLIGDADLLLMYLFFSIILSSWCSSSVMVRVNAIIAVRDVNFPYSGLLSIPSE